ncbi:GGDEF domain-containing protein [Pseudobacillus sp. FSL P4-0506]|uniref:GGDEF domain-containing protein n=1 Tax=unclassified Pseudobacillus TaxID=2619284 RepID=UPI0030F91BC5
MDNQQKKLVESEGSMKDELEKWKYLALHHELTKLPNRRMFYMSIESYMKRAQQAGNSLGIALIDIDEFKGINDLFGHSAGDRFLIETAKRLEALAEYGIDAFHLSGDEFLLLIEQDDHLEEKMNQVKAVFDTSFLVKDSHISIRASIGISLYPEQGQDIDKLLEYADLALYQAKSSMHHQCCFCYFTPHSPKE